MMTQTILLVEDNPADILLIQRAFRQADLSHISLQIVRDGDAAVLYLSGEREYLDRERYPLPILILLDLKLPRRSGHEVLEWLRQQPDLKRLPVIMLTAKAQDRDVLEGYKTGADMYLTKPFNPAELIAFAKRILSSQNEYGEKVYELGR